MPIAKGSALSLGGSKGGVQKVGGSGGHPANQIVVNAPESVKFVSSPSPCFVLESGKNYVAGAAVDWPHKLVSEPDIAIVGSNPVTSNLWTFQGAGTMIEIPNGGIFRTENFAANCPNAQMFNYQGAGGSDLFLMNLFVGQNAGGFIAQKFGTFTDILTLDIIDSSMADPASFGVNDGITLAGANIGFLSISKLAFVSISSAYVGLNLGTTVAANAFEITNFVNVGLAPGSAGISGLANSGNMAPGLLGTISNCDFIGAVTPLVGLSPNDKQVDFKNCAPVEDSSVICRIVLDEQTIIDMSLVTPGDFVDVNTTTASVGGNWVTTVQSRYISTSTGVMTSDTLTPLNTTFSGKVFVSTVGGSANKISAVITFDAYVPTIDSGGSVENSTATAIPLGTVIKMDALAIAPNPASARLQIANVNNNKNIILEKGSSIEVRA